jgi:hypothetical protein
MKNAALLRKPFVLALFLAALSTSLSSCGAGSLLPIADTPTRTATIIPSETMTPTPTATLPHTEWPVVFSDNFNAEDEKWAVGDYEYSDEFFKGTVSFLGGKYYAKITAKKPAYWYSFPEMEDLTDVFATVKVDQLSGSKYTEYGLIVRGGESVQYFFSFSWMLMGYEFNKFTADGISMLTLWTNSTKILMDEPSQIGVKAVGSDFALYINGEQVDDAADAEIVAGQVGLGILFPHAGDWIEITFDNFEVRAPALD